MLFYVAHMTLCMCMLVCFLLLRVAVVAASRSPQIFFDIPLAVRAHAAVISAVLIGIDPRNPRPMCARHVDMPEAGRDGC